MRITQVHLENIRSYKQQTISFDQGTILLCGDIGCGKSTILLAIEFALFGVLRDVDMAALLRNGETTGSVSVSFMLDKQSVTAHRALKRSKQGISQTSGWLEVDGARTEYSATELKANVLKLLSYPAHEVSKKENYLYRYTVYTSQEQMKNILNTDADKRLQTLRVVFGIDTYKRISDNASLLLTHLRAKVNSLAEKKKMFEGVSDKIIQCTHQLQTANQTVDSLSKMLVTATRHVETVRTKQKEIDTQLTLYQEKKKTLEHLTQTIQRLKTEFASHKNQARELAKELANTLQLLQTYAQLLPVKEILIVTVSEVTKTYEDLLEKKQTSASRDVLQERLQTLLEQLSQLAQSTIELEEANKKVFVTDSKAIQDELTQLQKKQTVLLSESMHMKTNIQMQKDAVKQIHDKSTCISCKQEIPHTHKETLAKDHVKIIASLEKKFVTKNSELNILVSQIEKVKLQLESAQTIQTQQAVLQQQIQELERKLESRPALITQITELKKQISTLPAAPTPSEIDFARVAMSTIQEQRELFVVYEKQVAQKKNLEEKKNSLDAQLSPLEQQMHSCKQEHNTCVKEKEEFQEELVQLPVLEKAKQAVEKEVQDVLEIQLVQERESAAQKATVTHLSETLLTLQKQEAEQGKLQTEQDTVQQKRQWIQDMFLPLMSVLEQNRFSQIHAEFSSVFSSYFTALIEDDTIQARLDETFTPMIEQNGYETSTSYLSGGERTSVALAYRLALNKVINEVFSVIKTKDLLILDEPTDGFSTEQLDRVRDVLLETGSKQTILVSHEPKIEAFVDTVIRVQKQDHVSVVIQ
ncbi:MAG: exonuclease SbcC [Candidatus Woesearchaeota archaeon]|jgi:exonuclease SbcC